MLINKRMQNDTIIPPFTLSNTLIINGIFSEDDNTLTFTIPHEGNIADKFYINCTPTDILSYEMSIQQNNGLDIIQKHVKIFAEQVVDKKITEYEVMFRGATYAFGFNTPITIPSILFSKLNPDTVVSLSVKFNPSFEVQNVPRTWLYATYKHYDLDTEQDKILALNNIPVVNLGFSQRQYFSTQVTQTQIDGSSTQVITLPFINFIERLFVKISSTTAKITLLDKIRNKLVKNGVIEINGNIKAVAPIKLSVVSGEPFKLWAYAHSGNILTYENGLVTTYYPSIYRPENQVQN